MKKKIAIASSIVLALIVGFSGGLLLGARALRTAQADALAGRWVGLVIDLAPQRLPYHGELWDPATVTTLAGSNLDALSILIAHEYSSLSPEQAHQVRAFAPQARAIAAAQQGAKIMHDRTHLRILAACLGPARPGGESVRDCAARRGMFGPVAAGASASSRSASAALASRHD